MCIQWIYGHWAGKTAAFLLPIISHLLDQKVPSNRGAFLVTPQAIVLTPTRELAIQISEQARKFSMGSNLCCRVAYWGTYPCRVTRNAPGFEGAFCSSKWLIIGRRNAAVFPDSVWAQAMRSHFVEMMGMAAFWTGVGVVYLIFFTLSQTRAGVYSWSWQSPVVRFPPCRLSWYRCTFRS